MADLPDWGSARTIARIFGGQGSLSVNSWSPDSRSLAFVSYPIEGQSRNDDTQRAR